MPKGGIDREFGRFSLNEKGYPRLFRKPHRNRYLHHLVFEKVAGREIRPGFHVHHQNNNKLCWCPHNLLEIQIELHPARAHPRCPYTGRFLTSSELEELREQRRKDSEVPF